MFSLPEVLSMNGAGRSKRETLPFSRYPYEQTLHQGQYSTPAYFCLTHPPYRYHYLIARKLLLLLSLLIVLGIDLLQDFVSMILTYM